MIDTEVKTRLAFCNEVDSLVAFVVIGNQPRINSGPAQFLLLYSFPAIRMAQNEFDMILNRT